ncbi:DUF5004 domain-containing protein [uncultured Dokdonia sp.]|uniref:DUF5004 domain-containing protein n=1 Tax=uncultured Dokdonia sp. TaxID=575653 RepID=UPI002615150B|nr:DUF5004 domain-containing protein [uncultured Dokdonia sp.]
MKNFFKFLSITLLAFTVSCSSDDDSSNSGGEENLVGGWDLVAYTLDQPQDINFDGTESTDVLAQVPCFDASITFMSNGNFSSSTDEIDFDIDIVNEEAVITCIDPVLNSGTWELNGNDLTTVSEGETETQTINFSGDTFSFSFPDPLFGETTFVFQRQ